MDMDCVIEMFEFLKSKSDLFLLKFEDYQSNFNKTTENLINWMGIKSPNIIRSSNTANYYFSNFDFMARTISFMFWRDILTKEDMDIINDVSQKFCNVFNYPHEIFAENLFQDLDVSAWEEKSEYISDIFREYRK